MAEIEVAGQKFELIKAGRGQAVQVHKLGHWLAQYGNQLIDIFTDRPAEGMDTAQGLSYLGGLIGSIPPDAMLELYEIVIGCSDEFAEEYFDLVVLIDSAITVYKEHPTLKALVDRFFSVAPSSEEQEDNSMISEEPMDGQTTKS